MAARRGLSLRPRGEPGGAVSTMVASRLRRICRFLSFHVTAISHHKVLAKVDAYETRSVPPFFASGSRPQRTSDATTVLLSYAELIYGRVSRPNPSK